MHPDHVLDALLAMEPLTCAEFREHAGAWPGAGFDLWFVDEAGASELTEGLGHAVPPGVLYAGGSVGIRRRVLRDHLAPATQSTLRHSLLALLAARAPLTEAELTGWMGEHLRLAVLEVPGTHLNAPLRAEVIARLDPPLNLRGTPQTPARVELSRLRSLVSCRPR